MAVALRGWRTCRTYSQSLHPITTAVAVMFIMQRRHRPTTWSRDRNALAPVENKAHIGANVPAGAILITAPSSPSAAAVIVLAIASAAA